MKTHNRFFQKICSFDNLLSAARKAQRGKRFQDQVARFNFHLERELYQLQAELQTQTYCPGPYHEFQIYEPKLRKISAAPYRDRVVHHALCNIIEPIFDPTFIFDSYACRKGKGTHKAVDRFTEFSRMHKTCGAPSATTIRQRIRTTTTVFVVRRLSSKNIFGLPELICLRGRRVISSVHL